MTPITPATGASLPYDVVSDAQLVDPDAPPMDHATLYDAALAATGGDVPAGTAPMTVYDAAAAYEAPQVDPYAAAAGGYDAGGISPVAGAQPAIAAAPTATVEDFAALGIFTDAELQQLAAMQLPPHELGILLQEAIAYMQSPEFAQQRAVTPQPGVGPAPQGDPTAAPRDADAPAGAADASGEPAWNDEWADRFRDALKEQGLSSKTRMMVVASLAQMPLTETDLQQAFEYYTTHPDGLAELQAADEQVRAGEGSQQKMMLMLGAGVLAAGAGTTMLARSTSNLSRVLTRTAANGADDAARAIANRALGALDGGTLARGSALADDAARVLRAEAAATSRLLHPIRKASTNAAARHLTASTKLSRADIARYGLWMKSGDAATDAARGAASATGAARTASTVAGGADDVTRAVASSADDVARGATQAARGAGMLSKAGRVLGPVGIVLSAGFGAWGIKQTMDAEGEFGEESAKMTGNVAGGIGGGIAGAAAGAAIGSVVPVIGTGIGAVVGGIVGGLGGGVVGEKVGGLLHGLFD